MNTGEYGSTCAADNGGLGFTAPKNGESTIALGPDAPAYYEVGDPTGAFAGKPAKGIMLIIHGGAWHTVGKGAVRYERKRAEPWRARGWQTVNLDYRACGQSTADVRWFLRRVRLLNPSAVICAQGASAGAHLALLLASNRELACAIVLGGPSDLLSLDGQTSYDPATGRMSTAGPTKLSNLAIAAFGAKPSPLVYASPKHYVGNVTARVLLASAQTDGLVPVEQNADYAAALRNKGGYADVALLAPGDKKFVHAYVSQESLDDLARREDALVAPLVANATTETGSGLRDLLHI